MENQTHTLTLVKKLTIKTLNFKLVILLRISKYKKIFAKGYVSNRSEEDFVIKKVKNTVPWAYVITDLKVEEIIRKYYKKDLQKSNKKEFRAEKVIKRKGDKLHVKWKGYANLFNSCIDKKGSINE